MNDLFLMPAVASNSNQFEYADYEEIVDQPVQFFPQRQRPAFRDPRARLRVLPETRNGRKIAFRQA